MATADLDDRGIIITCPECGQKNRLLYSRLADAVQCPRCKKKLSAPAAPIEVSRSSDFDHLIGSASIPVVVDSWAPWCGPCRMVAPELQKVAARQAGRVLVVKINTDALSDLGERFGIRSIPTLAVFAGAARSRGPQERGLRRTSRRSWNKRRKSSTMEHTATNGVHGKNGYRAFRF